ncbi:tRNA (guanosine(37)-N1)-methyltransferase TrmD [bacterium]|nr:tRNA (guanosine(37)-N1)-methyltransferase TrmD [bacterium]
MIWTVLTLFPGAFRGGPLGESLMARAIASGMIGVTPVDIRDYAEPPHRVCDDAPYGGGPGMVMKPEPVVRAFRAAESAGGKFDLVLAMSASGDRFTDSLAREFSKSRRICVLAGHYEGIDQRAIDLIGAREISIGDFLLTGGEVAALALIDSVSRYVPGVLGKDESRAEESYAMPAGILEYPQFTRPPEFEGCEVPEVLRGGNHAAVFAWRAREALKRTAARRPDLLDEKKIGATPYGKIYEELKREGEICHGQPNRHT